uniref:Peptidase A2 domain-containing protein n=1 Tax=Strongyloides papillosus TaxID=174720 RepID=A0A0N5BQJ5_STREA
MENNIGLATVIPLHKYTGKDNYFSYIQREFYLMDIDKDDNSTKFIKCFLKCQSEMTKNMFFQNYPDMEKWTISNIQDFCDRMSCDSTTHDLESIIAFKTAKKFPNESIQCYITRLKTILLPFKEFDDPLDVAVLCKIGFEADDDLKQKLCELEKLNIDSYVKAHIKFSSGITLKNKLKNNNGKTTFVKKLEHDTSATSDGKQPLSLNNAKIETIKQKKLLLPLSLTATPLIREAVRIFNRDVIVLIDSGATASILNLSTVEHHGWFYEKSTAMMEAYDGSISHSIGVLKGSVSILNNDIRVSETFHIVDKGENTITLNIAKLLNIDIYSKLEEIQSNRRSMITKIENINLTNSKLAKCLLQFPEVYNEEVLVPVKAHIKFSSGITLKNKLKNNNGKTTFVKKLEHDTPPTSDGKQPLSLNNAKIETIKQKKLLLPLSLTATPLIREAVRIFNRDVIVLIDSGATASILNLSTVEHHGWFYEKSTAIMEAYDGSITHSIGVLKGSVSILNNDVRVSETFHIVGKGENTITLNVAKLLNIDIYSKLEEIQSNRRSMITKIENINLTNSKLAKCLLQFPEVYNEEVLVPKIKVSFPLISEPNQILHKSYPQKGKKKQFLAETLMSEIREGKISQVDNPVLSSPVHIVGSEKMRMLIDGTDVNKVIQPITITLPSIQEMKVKMAGWEIFYKFDFTAAFKSLQVD